jgi:hypothetical protein
MSDHIVASYIAEMEQRLEAPYRWAIIGNFFVSCALAFLLGFWLLVL